MKLYYSPGTCSLSPHIVIKELGLEISLEKVDLKTKVTESGKNYLEINPKGQVPALMLNSGEVLTEGVAIVQYLSDLLPEKGLFPQEKGMAKYLQLELLNFISAEIHKSFSPFFNPAITEEGRIEAATRLTSKFSFFKKHLSQSKYLMGDSFTVADAYLFTVLNWANVVKVELPQFLKDYVARVGERKAVQEAMREEGLI